MIPYLKNWFRRQLARVGITWETTDYCAHDWFTRLIQIPLMNGEAVRIFSITYCKKCDVDKGYHDMQEVKDYVAIAVPSDFKNTEG